MKTGGTSEGRGIEPTGRVEIARVEPHVDGRGTVFEPVAPGALGDQRNVHVVLTEPGCVRGNHVHRRGTEILVVQGAARVAFRDGDGPREVDVASAEVVSFTIPAGVPHAVLNTGDSPNLLVAFRDRVYDPATPDSDPVRLLEPLGS